MTRDVMSHYGLHRPPFTAPTHPSDIVPVRRSYGGCDRDTRQHIGSHTSCIVRPPWPRQDDADGIRPTIHDRGARSYCPAIQAVRVTHLECRPV